MLIEELEEALSEILDSEFVIEVSKNGEVVIFTGLAVDDDGELLEFDNEDSDDDSLFDDDTEQFEDEEEDED